MNITHPLRKIWPWSEFHRINLRLGILDHCMEQLTCEDCQESYKLHSVTRDPSLGDYFMECP